MPLSTILTLLIFQQEYDDFVSSLLDSQSSKHQRLHDQMEQLSARGTSNPRVLRFESERVNDMESEAKNLIAENER